MKILHPSGRGCGLSRGFTLIELLVVISIIALLIGILLPALGKARESAQALKSQAGERSMTAGYIQYTADYKGFLMFGYPYGSSPTGFFGRVPGGIPTDEANPYSGGWSIPYDGQMITIAPSDTYQLSFYPFRLLPYVGDLVKVTHAHRTASPRPAVAGVADANFIYAVSTNPMYGLNSYYMGGHGQALTPASNGSGSNMGGFIGRVPNFGGHAVYKADDIRRPSQMIVFTESKSNSAVAATAAPLAAGVQPNYAGNMVDGYYVARPPFFSSWMSTGSWSPMLNYWNPGENNSGQPGTAMGSSGVNGMPSPWYGTGIATAFFDGHVKGMKVNDLYDMQLWSNRASSQFDVIPDNVTLDDVTP